MPTAEEWARRFWFAAYYIRRASDRDRSKAIEILSNICCNAPPPIAMRALATMKEIEHVQPAGAP